MKMSAYRVRVQDVDENEQVVDQVEHHVFKGLARQTCTAVATTGLQAQLCRVEVEAEPRDVLVAALDGDLEELVTVEVLETYIPTHEMKLAPGRWGWEVVSSEVADDG